MIVTPPRYGRRAVRFNAWAWLRSEPSITLEWAHLPRGARGRIKDHGDGTWTVTLSPFLSRVERHATLAHEYVHWSRGICGLSRLDERGVDDAAARLLVPYEELAAMYEIAIRNELPIEPWQVAEKFDVPDRVAERAMSLFLDERRIA